MNTEAMLQRAQAGDVDAMLEVADAYYCGYGLPEDDDAAEMWYQRAFEAAPNHPGVLCEKAGRCMQEVGFLKTVAPEQAEAKRKEALEMYSRAVDCGSGSACYKLGSLFLRGDMLADVPADGQKAAECFARGAELGSVGCMNLLAECYASGNGIPQDVPKAVALWQQAAELENPVALRKLAICYAQGDGVPQDGSRALEYNIRAAEAGEDYAALDAANMLLTGRLVPVDRQRGMMYLRKAADMGNEDAVRILAQYENTPAPETASPAPEKKKGCYIATAVYGSYDCPEVWTLRRFRDECMEKSAAGRLFVRLYYRISPWLVSHLGHMTGVERICRRVLDRFARWLRNRGYEDTPYQD